MDYHYRALDRSGMPVAGRSRASDAATLEKRLLRRQLEPLSIRPAYTYWPFAARISRRDLIDLCFQLEQLLGAGIPLLEALADLRDGAASAAMREALASLIEDIEGGNTLSQAMSAQPDIFPPLLAALVQAGECSGQLPPILDRYQHSLRWQESLSAHGLRLLIYPAIVATLVGSALLFLMITLVPQLRQFASRSGQELPLHARTLFALSDLLIAGWPWLLATATALIVASQLALARIPALRTRLDHWKLRLPRFGELHRQLIVARFADHFALLYAAGIPVLSILAILRPTLGNRLAEHAVFQAEQAIRSGSKLSSAFAQSTLFGPLVMRMLRIGEQTGNIDHALRHAAQYYQHAAEEGTARLQALMEPTLTLLLGLILGWVMLSVIGPIYDVIGRVA